MESKGQRTHGDVSGLLARGGVGVGVGHRRRGRFGSSRWAWPWPGDWRAVQYVGVEPRPSLETEIQEWLTKG